MSSEQWRAVFSYPPSILGPTPDDYGPERDTQEQASRDRPNRPEETHGWRSGLQYRVVTPWRHLSSWEKPT